MNTFSGHISDIQTKDSLSIVTVRIDDTILLKTIIVETPETASYLTKGHAIRVLFKETEVILAKEDLLSISVQNKIKGTIKSIETGVLLSKVYVSTNAGEVAAVLATEALTTLVLLVISIPLAYWLSNSTSRLKPIIETLVSMPLVLPPTVLGFYLLMAFSPGNALGSWLQDWLGVRLIFSFSGLVVGSVIYSLPFMVNPIQSGLSSLSPALAEASYVLGKSKVKTLFTVLLPNIKPSVLTGIVLAFAHTVGEFGVVLMIGGNIPEKTKVVSIAIYDEVEALNYGNAHVYSLILIVITFVILLSVYLINGGYLKRFWK